jgi:choline dehydrogenase-like flavoprotein
MISIGPVTVKKQYDYIVLGAGSAGCAAAGTLAKYNKNASIALIEAGPPDSSVFVDSIMAAACVVPGIFPLPAANKFLWPIESTPSQTMAGRKTYHPRGCGLGGCSSINASLYIRGQPEDYDDWGKKFKGWSYDDVLPVFMRMEANSRGANECHGDRGTLSVEDTSPALFNSLPNCLFQEACESAGIPQNGDFNSKKGPFGHGRYQINSKNGHRCNAYDAHIAPIIHERPNLQVMTNTAALTLKFEGKRCVGVTCARRSDGGAIDAANPIEYSAKEVIVSLGAFHTPALLQRSGLGDKHSILSLGVPKVILDNPEIGKNLMEHLDVVVSIKAPILDNTRAPCMRNVWYLLDQWKEWRSEGTGQFSNIVELGAFLRSSADKDRPDIQLHYVTAPLIDHGRKVCLWNGVSLHACNLYPKSRGTVKIKSIKPQDNPDIDMNFLSDPHDMPVMEECLSWAQLLIDPDYGLLGVRSVTNEGPRHPFLAYKGIGHNPPYEVRTRDQRQSWIRQNADGVYHPMGTCAMGTVVDDKLRVMDVDGLRVADCSIFPAPIGGNTNAPAQMVGARCADFISESWGKN